MKTEYYNKLIDSLFESGRPVIVVFREKHGDHLLACLDRCELEQVCLYALWERYHLGYFIVNSKPTLPPIPKDKIDAMPDGETKSGAVEEWKCYDRECSWHKDASRQLETVETALRDRDGTSAFAVLRARSDREYEYFGFEIGEKVDGPPEVDLLNIEPDNNY